MTTTRVLYADTDMAGVVYHANYLRYFEQARTERLYALGIDIARLHREDGLVFAVSDAALKYHQSAYYGDLLRIEVLGVKLGPARLTLGYRVYRNDHAEPCVTGTTTLVALDATTGRVVRFPAAMRAALAANLEGADHAS